MQGGIQLVAATFILVAANFAAFGVETRYGSTSSALIIYQGAGQQTARMATGGPLSVFYTSMPAAEKEFSSYLQRFSNSCSFGSLSTGNSSHFQSTGTCTFTGGPFVGTWPASVEIDISGGPWGPCPAGSAINPNTGDCAVWDASISTDQDSARGEPEFCRVVGDPINPATAGKYQIETDFVGNGVFPITFRRYHNSAIGSGFPETSTYLGRGWRHSYDRRLFPVSGTLVYASRADGRRFTFQLNAGQWISSIPNTPRLFPIPASGTQTGWLLFDLDDTVEIYNLGGLLVEIRDRQGNRQLLSYNAAGTLTRVEDGFGRWIQLSYGVEPTYAVILTGFTASSGESVQFTRHYGSNHSSDPSHDTVVYPDAKTKRYIYDESLGNPSPNSFRWALTGILDENGNRYATFRYDNTGRAIESDVGGGIERYTIQYQSGGSRLVTDPRGTQRTYGFALVSGRVRQSLLSEPCSQGCSSSSASATYDVNGNVASDTDFNGNLIQYQYDLARNLETQRVEAVGQPEQRTIRTQWHPTFRLPTGIAEPLRISTYVYNGDSGSACGYQADGQTLVPGVVCSKSIQATTDTSGAQGFAATPSGAPRTWTYTYGTSGQVLTANGPRTDVADVTTYTYYPSNDPDLGKRGNVATITNAANHVTQITAYNGRGQPLTVVDPNGLTVSLAYDARGRLTSRSVGGEVTTFIYDGAGQTTQVILPDASSLAYTYDAAHRLTAITDNLGNRIAFTLDAMGNRTREEVFDAGNNLAQTRSRVYSNLNRLFQDIGATNQTTQYGYDNQGNVTSVSDPLSRITASQYDALNRLKRVTDPGNGVTQYSYDGLNQLTLVTDPRNVMTGYSVDGLGNLTLQASQDSGTTASTYDAAGNRLTRTDAKGQLTTYTYDALNRVSSILYSDGLRQTYNYDQGTNGLGRLTNITGTDSQNQLVALINFGYDQKGRVISHYEAFDDWATQHTTGYQYDSAGRLTAISYPFSSGTSGATVSYSLDSLGRVGQISITYYDSTLNPPATATKVLVQNIQYHPFGGVKSFGYGNGQSHVREIDQDGRIGTYTLGGTQFNVGYDAASRLNSIVENGNPANLNTYSYDALDRLTQANVPGSSFGYGYDPAGNRLTKTIGASTDTYTYSSTSNRLASITPGAGAPRTYVHDANGSVTNDGLLQNVYDPRGRLVQSTNLAACLVAKFRVNAVGERVRKTVTQCDTGALVADTLYVYDLAGRLIAETTPQGVYKRAYIYLYDIPVAMTHEQYD